jgi:amino acid transporter
VDLAALIVSIIAVIVSAWSLNHQRLLWCWTRDRNTVAMPKLWHVRYHRSTAPVVLHVNGTMTSQTAALIEQIRTAIHKRPPGTRTLS